MAIKLVGDDFEEVERLDTGIFTFNKAMGDLNGNVGLPKRAAIEWYGPKSSGKTTTAMDLAGLAATTDALQLTLLDLEGQHHDTIMEVLKNIGFDGDFNYMTFKKGEAPEALMDRFTALMDTEGTGIAVVDSLGAYTSKAELSGKLGEANMGEKARELGKFAGRLMYASQTDKKNAKIIFLINHQHPAIGAFAHGSITTGGEKKKYLSQIRVALKSGFLGTASIKFPTGQLVEGKVENNRFGFPNGHFWIYIEYGRGIHRGLTAMWECIALKLAQVSAQSIKEGTTVALDGQKLGKIGDFIAHAHDEDYIEIFNLFHNKLKQNADVNIEEEETE
jgi:recombination protein RecA